MSPQLLEWAIFISKCAPGASRVELLERRQANAIHKIASMSQSTTTSLDLGTPAVALSHSPLLPISETTKLDTEKTIRVRQACILKHLRSARLCHVPSDYYKLGLNYRRDCLNAPAISYLCKTVILENTHWAPDATPSLVSPGALSSSSFAGASLTNAQYYAVVIQYVRDKVRTEKMTAAWQALNPGIGKKKFNFRMAPPEVAERVTGFSFGGIVPIGTAEPIPVVLDQCIAEGKAMKAGFFYLGGGETDWKLRISVADFLAATSALVADVTSALPDDEVNAMAKGLKEEAM